MASADIPSRRQPRLGLAALSILAALPPVLHYAAIAPLMDSARIMGGLLPAPLLLLRSLGAGSAFVAATVLLALAYSFARRELAETLFRRAAALLLLFSVGYLCCALFVIAFLLATSAI